MKKRRIFCFCFALIIAFLIPFNAFAFGPVNLDDDLLFTPFRIVVSGSIFSSDVNLDGLEYELTPLDQLYNTAYLRPAPSSIESSTVYSSYSVNGSSVTFRMVPTSTKKFGLFDVLDTEFNLYSTSSSSISLAPGVVTVYFLGGFLSPQYSMFTAYDGCVFSTYNRSVGTSTLVTRQYYGELSLPGEFADYWFSYSGESLNYYQALINSDIDWISILPPDIDVDVWNEYFASFSSFDFENLSSDDLDKLRYCFSFVGPVSSMAACDLSFTSGGSSTALGFNFLYSFIHSYDFDRVYRDTKEIANASNKTPFQRITNFLGSATSGFLAVELMPDFTIGGVLLILIAFSLVMWWLKVFAGG